MYEKLKDAADTAALLLASGADPNQCRAGHDWPPLVYCIVRGMPEWGQPEAMRHLLDAGADPNPTFVWGGKPTQLLELAADWGGPQLLLPLVQHADLSSQLAATLDKMYAGLCE